MIHNNWLIKMKFESSSKLILLAILACVFAVPCAAQEPDFENVPSDVAMELAMGAFAQTYSVSNRINPFYLRGDFDGDGTQDYAFLVVAKKDNSRGIAILLSSQKKLFVLGAGQPFKFARGQATDFDFINMWQVYGKKPVERGVEAGPPPKLIGEAILAGKRESASGLIYWNGKSFMWYQQGD